MLSFFPCFFLLMLISTQVIYQLPFILKFRCILVKKCPAATGNGWYKLHFYCEILVDPTYPYVCKLREIVLSCPSLLLLMRMTSQMKWVHFGMQNVSFLFSFCFGNRSTRLYFPASFTWGSHSTEQYYGNKPLSEYRCSTTLIYLMYSKYHDTSFSVNLMMLWFF